MAWMHAYIAVPNLLSMISMGSHGRLNGQSRNSLLSNMGPVMYCTAAPSPHYTVHCQKNLILKYTISLLLGRVFKL
jgi:hypothetical protein